MTSVSAVLRKVDTRRYLRDVVEESRKRFNGVGADVVELVDELFRGLRWWTSKAINRDVHQDLHKNM
jgi:hypothetical protein